MESLKINYIMYGTRRTGGTRVLFNFINELVKLGHEVSITTLYYKNWFLFGYHIHLCKKMKLNIIEIPLPYHHTENGKIHVILTTVGHLLTIIAFMVRHSRFYRYIPDWARSLYYRKFRGM